MGRLELLPNPPPARSALSTLPEVPPNIAALLIHSKILFHPGNYTARAYCRMNQLPLELISTVFRHLKLKDCIRASHVCSRWRHAALSDPVVWTVASTDGISPAGFEEILSRTGVAPVDVELEITPDTEPQAIHLLAKHMHHLRRLVLPVWFGFYSDALAAALCAAAPLLESFEILAHDVNGIVLPEQLFSGVAPALRSVALLTAQLPRACPAVLHLAQLRIALPDEPPHTPYVLSTSCPNLRTLLLTGLQYGAHYALADAHKLERLEIRVAADTMDVPRRLEVAAQLRALNHHLAAHIVVRQTTDKSRVVGCVLDSVARDLQTLELGTPAESWAEVCLTLRAPGRTRVFPVINAFNVQQALDADASRVASVTRVYVAHHLLSILPLRMPALRMLCVESGRAGRELDHDHLGQWLDRERTPGLEILTFNAQTAQMHLRATLLALAISSRGTQIGKLSVVDVQFEEEQEGARSLLRPTCNVLEWSSTQTVVS